MDCKICGSGTTHLFIKKILNKYDANYYQCNKCYFIQTEQTYWLDEAYNNALTNQDTGQIVRNSNLSKATATISIIGGIKIAKGLDWGAGYGLYVRMMRDIGFDFYWSDKYAQNLFCRGLEDKSTNSYDVVTAFELFEHLDNPLADISSMLTKADTIIFSTEVFKEKAPEMSWWYYGFEHGQHISLYSVHTLKYLSQKYNMYLYSNGRSLHILSRKKRNKLLLNLSLRWYKYLFPFIKPTLNSFTLMDSKMAH